jgi:LysM repeat protein
MRIRELIQSKRSDVISETVHDPAIDWNKFKLALAAFSAGDKNLAEFGRIDAILFLGIIGDPNSQSVIEQVELRKPVRIGIADKDSVADLNFEPPDGKSRIAGEFYGFGGYRDKDVPPGQVDRGEPLRRTYQYNIIINQRYFDQATGEISSDLLAHEVRHRGFGILEKIPEIRKNINPRTNQYIDYKGYEAQDIIPLCKNTGKRNSVEHLMMYSFELPDRIGPDSTDGSDNGNQFRSKEEVKMFQQMYRDCERAAAAYIKRFPVPKGGFELLRKEVDRLTPDSVEITVKPDAEGKPIVTGRLTDEEIERRNKLIQGGANVDKTGKVITPTATTKLTPAEIERRNKAIQGGANLDKGGRSLGDYTVKSGDSISKIAAAKGISLPDLIKANPQFKNPDLIYPGDQVIIPKKL